MSRLRRWLIHALGGVTNIYINGISAQAITEIWAAVVINDNCEAVLFMTMDGPPEFMAIPPEHKDKSFWAPMIWPDERTARAGLDELKDVLALMDGPDIALRCYGPAEFIEWVRKA